MEWIFVFLRHQHLTHKDLGYISEGTRTTFSTLVMSIDPRRNTVIVWITKQLYAHYWNFKTDLPKITQLLIPRSGWLEASPLWGGRLSPSWSDWQLCQDFRSKSKIDDFWTKCEKIVCRRLAWQQTVWPWLAACLPSRRPGSPTSTSASTHWWAFTPLTLTCWKSSILILALGARKVWVCVQATDGGSQQGLVNPLLHSPMPLHHLLH